MEIPPFRRTMTPRERTILRGVVRKNRPTWLIHVENATEAPLWMRNEMRTWLHNEVEWTDDWEPTPFGYELEELIGVLGPNEDDEADAHLGGPRPTLGSYLKAASAMQGTNSSRASDLAYPAAVVSWALELVWDAMYARYRLVQCRVHRRLRRARRLLRRISRR